MRWYRLGDDAPCLSLVRVAFDLHRALSWRRRNWFNIDGQSAINCFTLNVDKDEDEDNEKEGRCETQTSWMVVASTAHNNQQPNTRRQTYHFQQYI